MRSPSPLSSYWHNKVLLHLIIGRYSITTAAAAPRHRRSECWTLFLFQILPLGNRSVRLSKVSVRARLRQRRSESNLTVQRTIAQTFVDTVLHICQGHSAAIAVDTVYSAMSFVISRQKETPPSRRDGIISPLHLSPDFLGVYCCCRPAICQHRPAAASVSPREKRLRS